MQAYRIEIAAHLKELRAAGHIDAGTAEACQQLCVRAHGCSNRPVDWDRIEEPNKNSLFPMSRIMGRQLARERVRELLSKVVVLKLNGGIGTTMGCTAPKTSIAVKEGLSFLEIICRQIAALNESVGVDIPLVFMNSPVTEATTRAIIKEKGLGRNVAIHHFNQSLYPRLEEATLLPSATMSPLSKDYWYPPGHGDVLPSFMRSGLGEAFWAAGKRWVFISNGDNLGATVSPHILEFLETSAGIEALMEVTPKTPADVKGGTLISLGGRVRLLELAQVPAEHVAEFADVKRFKVFNTNNLWFSLAAMRRNPQPELPIIFNKKRVCGEPIVQLETAVGASIETFRGSGIIVPRERFLPVKGTSDLLLVRSDVFALEKDFTLRQTTPARPAVRLSPEYNAIAEFEEYFPTSPSLRNSTSFEVDGPVRFGRDVSVEGDVIIRAADSSEVLDFATLRGCEGVLV